MNNINTVPPQVIDEARTWTTAQTFNTAPLLSDDVLLKFGTDGDIGIVLRSTTLNANTALTGVIEGTPVTPALAANSLIIGNITNDGDLLLVASDGGHTRTALFFDASTPDTYLYNVGGTWTAGATTWTLPPFTLGGNITINAKIFDAGSGNAEIRTTGADGGLLIRSTQDGVVGALCQGYQFSASPAVDDKIFTIRGYGKDSNADAVNYGEFNFMIEDPTNTTECGKMQWRCAVNDVLNTAMTLSSGGVLAVDLSGSASAAQVDLFDKYDDALMLRQGIQQNNRELLANAGVLTRKDTGSGYMMNLQPMVRLLAGGIYQTRQRLEDTRNEMNDRLVLVEKKLKTLPSGGA